ncbi:MAG TPA: sugar kinase, partial [Polyangia bacterium]
ELLLRLSAPDHERLLQSPHLGANFGGGEANVAVSLAHFGLESRFVTRLPDNAIGDAAVRALRAEGVGVDGIVRGGERVGIYFAERGASQRASMVVYDRAHSSASELSSSSIRWPELLAGAAAFHTTGITPALGRGPAECTRSALAAAREAGASVSVDLNFRRKLWRQADAQAVMRPLMRYVNLIIANEEDLQTVLGVPISQSDPTRGRLDVEAYGAAAARVVAEYGVQRIAITLRESISASENGWSALLYDAATKSVYRGPRYLVRIVDRIGGGDSFAAGLIFALAEGRSPEHALRFAVAASALKQTIPGDFNRVSVAEVQRLAAGDESGRVQR